ncbi:hypothetical protein AZZ84_001772, partial [Escherichia coli]
ISPLTPRILQPTLPISPLTLRILRLIPPI